MYIVYFLRTGSSIAWRTLRFNLRPPCGGRPGETGVAAGDIAISIHVLRVEDDHGQVIDVAFASISIHVLRVEDDLGLRTQSAGGEYFNPRPPCGGRHLEMALFPADFLFQSTSSMWRTT